MSRWLGLVSVLMLAGCPTKNNARYCESNAACTDPRFPMCDLAKRECVGTNALIDLGMVDLSGNADDLSGADFSMPDLTGADLAVTLDMLMTCASHGDCPAATPLCNMASKMCQPCSSAADDAQCALRQASTPKCKLTGANKGFCMGICGVHNDCTSKVCESDGVCAAEGDVLYINNVNGTCTGSHAGTLADPLCEVPSPEPSVIRTSAGFLGKPYVHYEGSNTTYAPLRIETQPTPSPSPIGSVTLVGPGASISGHRVSNPWSAISVITGGHPVTVTVDGLDLRGSQNGVGGVLFDSSAVYCDAIDGAINLTLVRTTMHDSGFDGVNSNGCVLTTRECVVTANDDDGIQVSGGSLDLDQCRVSSNLDNGVVLDSGASADLNQCSISGNGDDGLDVTGGSFTIDRCSIFGNTNVGIVMGDGPTYTITNDFIFNNGWGVDFSTLGNDGVFQFNTVATNGAGINNDERGIICESGSAPTRTLQASIVWGNGQKSSKQFKGDKCKLLNVVTSADAYDRGEIEMDPSFVRPSPSPMPDYHLVAGAGANTACCIDKVGGPLDGGTPLSNHDYDGETRPHPTFSDVGADEVH